MQSYKFQELRLKGAYLIETFFAEDQRGGFVKDYSREIFERNGIRHDLQETFYTISHKGVIRALHFQEVKEQAKLVRCITGKIYDVIVDLRKDSDTYKQWQGFYLSGERFEELLVPEHFAHGYLVLQDSIVSYKCAQKFYPEYDTGIIWNDAGIGIDWPIEEIGGLQNLIIADKDLKLKSFKEKFEQ